MKYFFLILFFYFSTKIGLSQNFIHQKGIHFYENNKPYKYIGTNYWYGGLLLSDTIHDGKKRLIHELDFLKKKGINNLRVFMTFEGDCSYPFRVYPSLQEKPMKYNEKLLKGYDFLIAEAEKRKIKIVFVLNNNWEWSGGFGQYLEWAGFKNPPLPKTQIWDWDNYCEYISKFYSCNECKKWNQNWISYILNRKNKITKRYYKDEPTIMAWELANEPRPMKKGAIIDYKKWISETSSFIKSIDKNHLVTIGVEGVISTMNSETIFKEIHSFPTVDYATIHLWPKTWQWYNGKSNESISDSTLEKSIKYIEQHAKICTQLKKPLVIEEFGLHRDENSFSSKMSTENRDIYYKTIFTTGKINHVAGYNFWGFAGISSNENEDHFMQKGMPYSADPPQEEQGLYSVFESDTSTWKLIEKIKD